MAISLKILKEMFPKDKPAFEAPFRVETDEDGEVHIYDAQDDILATFARYTQMPINDERALAYEVSYWEGEARRVVAALNASYPTAPDDWLLAPKEPTAAMISAAKSTTSAALTSSHATEIYVAMLAASSTPTSQP